MTITDSEHRPFKTGRKPQKPEGERFAIGWLHEYDRDVVPGTSVTYPVDVSQGIELWKMLGNGPADADDPVTVPMPAGDSPDSGEGDCHWAGVGHDYMAAGAHPTADQILTAYNAWSAQSQGVPAGQEQDEGTNMADAFLWGLTHDLLGNEVPQGSGLLELFAPVHPATLGAVMAKYGRGILMGVNCTPCDQSNFPTGWTVTASCQPDPQDGHVVYLVILNGPIGTSEGSGEPVSWGQKVPADPAWLADCPEEWWIILVPADAAKMGQAAYDALARDLAALPNAHGSSPAPAVSPPEPPDAPPSPSVAPPSPEPVQPPVDPAHITVDELKELAAALRAILERIEERLSNL